MASKMDTRVVALLAAVVIASSAAISSSISYTISHKRDVMKSSPGDYFLDFMQDRPFDRMKVEIDCANGGEPAANTTKFLGERIAANCGKSSVTMLLSDIIATEDTRNNYTYDDINGLESKYRTCYHSELTGTITLYVKIGRAHV